MAKKKTGTLFIAISLILAIVIIVLTVIVFKKMGYRDKYETSNGVEENVISYNGTNYVPNNDITTFLVIGLDTFSSKDNQSSDDKKQADFIVLFAFDNTNERYSAIHINRDTMTEVNLLALDGTKANIVREQIALAHTEGNGKEISCRNTADAVSNLLLGANVDYYASFTMDSVPVINDSVGGVSVTVEDDMTVIDPAFKKGATVKLIGNQALNFVRARGGLTDNTNLNRMSRQRVYMESLFTAIRESLEANQDYLEDTFMKISDNVVTNRSVNQLKNLSDKFHDYKFTGIHSIDGEAKVGERFMEFYPDRNSLEKTVIELFYKEK